MKLVKPVMVGQNARLFITALLCMQVLHAGASSVNEQVQDHGPLGLDADLLASKSEAAIQAWHIKRNANVIRQSTSFSCAAAALANYLTFALKQPATEAQLLESIQSDGSKLMSVSEIKRMAASVGVRLNVYDLTWAQLSKPGNLPGIVRIKYLSAPDAGHGTSASQDFHFVMIDKVINGQVHIKDPSIGNITMPAREFLAMWKTNEAAQRGYFISSINVQQ